MNKTNQIAATETQAFEVIRLAQTHEHLGAMSSSAVLCAQDAAAEFNVGNFTAAARRAVESLRYSVGILSPVYQSVQAFRA